MSSSSWINNKINDINIFDICSFSDKEFLSISKIRFFSHVQFRLRITFIFNFFFISEHFWFLSFDRSLPREWDEKMNIFENIENDWMHAIYCEDNDLKCQVGSLTVLEVQFMSQVIKIILTIKFTKYRSRWVVQDKKKKKKKKKKKWKRKTNRSNI
jgi:hypothetical protein